MKNTHALSGQGESVETQHEAVMTAILGIFRNGLKYVSKAKVPEMRQHVDTIIDAFKQSTHMNEILVDKCVSLQAQGTLVMHANDHFQKKLQFLQSKNTSLL